MKGAERICWRSGPSKRAKEHLASSIERLALYCRSPRARAKRATDFDLHEETKQYTTHWPSHELLKSIEDDVRTLTLLARNKWPRGVPWQAFQLVDKHLPALLLVLRVNDLVDRARKRLTQAGLSELEKLLSKPRSAASNLFRDIERVRNNPGDAQAIDWAKHKTVLRRDGVEPDRSGSAAVPLDATCCARVLELMVDDYQRTPVRIKSLPLLRWIARIGHPAKEYLLPFYIAAGYSPGADQPVADGTQRQRENTCERVRRHRARKR